MNENPYRSPEDDEAKFTQIRVAWKDRIGACVFGYISGGCCAILFGPLVVIALLKSRGIEFVRYLDQIPVVGRPLVFGALLTPAFMIGAVAARRYLRADERQRKMGGLYLGGCAVGAIVLNVLLEWLF